MMKLDKETSMIQYEEDSAHYKILNDLTKDELIERYMYRFDRSKTIMILVMILSFALGVLVHALVSL